MDPADQTLATEKRVERALRLVNSSDPELHGAAKKLWQELFSSLAVFSQIAWMLHNPTTSDQAHLAA